MSFGLSLYAADGSERLSNINTVLRKVFEAEYSLNATQTDSVSPFNNPVAALEIAPVGLRIVVNGTPQYKFGYAGNTNVNYSDSNEEVTFVQTAPSSIFLLQTPQMVALYSYV